MFPWSFIIVGKCATNTCMYGVTCYDWYTDVNKVIQSEALYVKSLISISFILLSDQRISYMVLKSFHSC